MTPDQSPNTQFVEDNTPRVLTPGRHISHSQVEMFNRCSMQYYFRYVQGLKERPKLPLAVGKGAHAALEYNARQKIKTGSDVAVQDLRDMTADLVEAAISEIDPKDIESDQDPGKAKDDVIASITQFRLRDAPSITPIAAEWEFNLDLAPTENLEYPLRIVNGKVDIVEAVTIRIGREIQTQAAIKDYKITGRAKPQLEVDLSRQLDLYATAYERATGRAPAQLGIRQFLPSTQKQPARAEQLLRSPERMTPEYRKARTDRLIHVYQNTDKSINAGIFMPVDDPRTCSWCGYRERCQFSLVKDDYEASRIRARDTA